jgi:conjugative transfer signal peptidase TraF
MKASPRQRRVLIGLIMAVGASATVSMAVELPKAVFWNASASVPIGFYVARPVRELAVGDLVIVRPPNHIAHFAAERGYLGSGVPMLKHVAALSGSRVCREGALVTVADVRVRARRSDRLGRALPSWSGCRTVRADEVLLLNPAAPDSFDGRYFGPLPRSTMIARAVPVWRPTPAR